MKAISHLDPAALLKRFGLRADKSLGQNFLRDDLALETIAAAAEILPTDSALEIGPGLGSLTRHLAQAAREVVAIELDDRLLPPLRTVLAPYDNVRVVAGDILKLAPRELITAREYIVVANIPYYITSAVIRHLLENEIKPRRIVLTIQKEVAERICAQPGDLSLLALSVQIYGEPHIVARIPAQAFFPAPKVDSAVLRVDIFPNPRIEPELLKTFFQLTKAGFSQKRKTLRNSLSAGLHIAPLQAETLLQQARIESRRRAETLSIDEWRALCERYKR
ncbi:MAG: ribosomal RNA small subunit methyltransferase A [Anaerolineaceae bacterium]|nr:MAG: ribosomal RNA small subunit methyltransferase A [Anaerolineaceae bacterium]